MLDNNNKIDMILRYFIALCIFYVLFYHVQSQEDILLVLGEFNTYRLIPVLLVIIFHGVLRT